MTTLDQEQAINTLNMNLVVSAGAGAGKTYVLVKRFVNVLLRSQTPGRLNSVVAITFTRAAAMEMRERIRNELERRYQGKKEHEDEVISADDRLLSGILLAQMDSARIDTIHALCATIVRANAAEAEVDPRFEVQDATQQKLRLSALIRDTLQATHNDALDLLVTHYGLDMVEKQLEGAFSSPLMPQPPRVEDLVTRWQNHPEYKSLPEPDLQALAHLTVAWDQVIRHMQAVYAAEKRSLGVLDFDDLEKKTVELLNTFPYVRARYQGSEFQQLLVDEFQDTNNAQWDIVKALGNVQKQGTLFIVGDVKQSIYGFRRADVRVFADVKAQIEAHNGMALKLAMSFRSTLSLITLFNALFKKLLVTQADSQAQAYQVVFDHAMEVHRQDQSDFPAMRLILLRKKPAEIAVSGFRGIKAEYRRMWEGEEIAQQITDLKNKGIMILDREKKGHRPFKYGDVAILMRTLNEASHYEDALQRAGIPYVTFSGKGFYGLQEIYDVQNMLRVLQNTQDSLALAAVLRSPLFGLSDETLFSLRRLKPFDDELQNQPLPVLWDQLMWIADGTLTLFLSEEEKSRIDRAANIIMGLQTYAGRASSAELMRAIFTQTGYLATVNSLPQGAQRRRNLEKLLDTAQSLSHMSPAAFTHHLTELAKSSGDIREGEAAMEANDVVKLMTVHASKGLEYPIIFLADASPFRESKNLGDVYVTWDERGEGQLLARPKNSSMSQKPKPDEVPPPPDFESYQKFLQDKDAAEELRLLYVAATRARDMFYISGEVTEDKNGDLSAKGWLGHMLRALDIKKAFDQQKILWENETIEIFLPSYPLTKLPDPTVKETEKTEPAPDPSADRLQATWTQLAEDIEHAVAVAPSLLPPVIIEPRKFAEHMTATQLATFGVSLDPETPSKKRHYRDAARRTVLYDVPGVVRAAVRPYDPRVTQRIIGDMVHEALRFERYPSITPTLDKILESYAWNKGLTQQHDLDDAVKRARSLLRRFEQSSDVYAWIQESKQARKSVYRELPFLCRRLDGRILHGVIDILFQRPSGQWVIIDYKTGYVPAADAPDYTRHSRRYHLQVGAYAEAVKEYVNSTPEVYIHYVRYCKTEQIPIDQWQNAIGRLESTVIDVMGAGL